jgi:hypothetical protein
MPRTALPLEVADISAFARTLRDQLDKLDHTPTHVELLNLLSRSVGFRNFQHFRADAKSRKRLEQPDEAPSPPDHALVEKVARNFDIAGRLTRWPPKPSHHELCLWFIWSRIPAMQPFTEREISDFLDRHHTFGDHALLRRALYDFGMVYRTRDGSEYRRKERKPPAELRTLLERISVREKAAQPA